MVNLLERLEESAAELGDSVAGSVGSLKESIAGCNEPRELIPLVKVFHLHTLCSGKSNVAHGPFSPGLNSCYGPRSSYNLKASNAHFVMSARLALFLTMSCR